MSQIRKKERKNWFYSYNMIFDLQISEHAKMVYIYLCRCADDEGQAFPSHSTIAQKCSIKSRQTVMNAIAELEDIGLLSKIQRTRKDKGQTSNLYTIYDTPTPVQQIDTPCPADGHPPVQQMDTPCPADGHEGLPSEGLPIIKSVSQSVSVSEEAADRQKDRRKGSVNSSTEEPSEAEATLAELIARTKIHNEPTLQELWLPVFEYMIFAPTFPAAVNRPKSMILNRIQQITRETLYNAYRRVDTHLKLTGTQVTNSVAYLAVALYNEIGRESADNGLAFSSSNYCSSEEIEDSIASLATGGSRSVF